MKDKYTKLDLIPFGHSLLDTLDLDPIYCMMYDSHLDTKLQYKLILAYILFYHAGVASKIAEAKDFYRTANQAQQEKWPRGRERRHFRGQASQNVLDWFRAAFPNPEKAIEGLLGSKTFPQIYKRMDNWPLFGLWARFKTADLVDRVIGNPIKMDIADLQLYESPVEAAKEWRPNWTLRQVVEYVIDQYKDRLAPPRFDRPIGIFEAETCLCKGASHWHGHYPVGSDTHEINEHLVGWGDLAQELKRHLPKTI